MGLRDSIRKRASRIFHRDGAENTSEGPNSEPSSNRNSLNAADRKSQSRHRKSLSLLSRTSRSEHKVDHEAPQSKPAGAPQNTNGFLAHPAVQPLEADLTPKTPRLERQRPGIQLEDAGEAHTDGNAGGSEYFDASSDQAARQHTMGVENANHQKARPANSPDAEDLERRLSRLAVSQQESELPEIEVDPLTPFNHFEETHYDQAKLSRLAIGQEGPERAATYIIPLSQESDVNMESNISQEGNIKHNLEAIHSRDAEFDRINKEVQAGSEGGSNFHLQNSLDFDRTVHTDRDPVVHEHQKNHVHEIRQIHRSISVHHHEHRTVIQPIKDPNPTILPEQHWLQDDKTGEIYRIPDELGKQLM